MKRVARKTEKIINYRVRGPRPYGNVWCFCFGHLVLECLYSQCTSQFAYCSVVVSGEERVSSPVHLATILVALKL